MSNALLEKDSPRGRYGLANPRTVERVAEARLPTDFGEFRIAGYRSRYSDEEFVALDRGELRGGRPTLARIHSQCLTGDVFGSTKRRLRTVPQDEEGEDGSPHPPGALGDGC